MRSRFRITSDSNTFANISSRVRSSDAVGDEANWLQNLREITETRDFEADLGMLISGVSVLEDLLRGRMS